MMDMRERMRRCEWYRTLASYRSPDTYRVRDDGSFEIVAGKTTEWSARCAKRRGHRGVHGRYFWHLWLIRIRGSRIKP